MPASTTDPEVDAIYAELNKRGVFKSDPEAQAIGHELRARGVVSDPTQGGLVTPPAPFFVPPTDLSATGLQRNLVLNSLNQTGAPEALKNQVGTLFGGADMAESAVGDYQKTHPDVGSLDDLMSRENVLKNTQKTGQGNPALNGIPGTPIHNDALKYGNVISRPVYSKGYNAYTVATFEGSRVPHFYDSDGVPLPNDDLRVQKYFDAHPGETSARDVGEGLRSGFQNAGHVLGGLASDFSNVSIAAKGAQRLDKKLFPKGSAVTKTLQGIPQGISNVVEGFPAFAGQVAETAAATPFALAGNQEAQNEVYEAGQGLNKSLGLGRGGNGEPTGPVTKMLQGNVGGGFSQMGDKAQEDLPMTIMTLIGGFHALRGGAIEAGRQAVDIYEGKARAAEAEASSAPSPELENQYHDQAQVYREKADKIRQRLPASARFTKKQVGPLTVPLVEATVHAPADHGSVAEAVNTAQDQIKASETPAAQPEPVAVHTSELSDEQITNEQKSLQDQIDKSKRLGLPAQGAKERLSELQAESQDRSKRSEHNLPPLEPGDLVHTVEPGETTPTVWTVLENDSRGRVKVSVPTPDGGTFEKTIPFSDIEGYQKQAPKAIAPPVEAPAASAQPVAPLTPDEPAVTPTSTRRDVQKAVQEHFGYTDEQTDAAMALADNFARNSGRPYDDWYREYVAGIGKGEPVSQPRSVAAPAPVESPKAVEPAPTPEPAPVADEPAPADYQRTPFQKKGIPGPPKRVEMVAEPVKVSEPIAASAPVAEVPAAPEPVAKPKAKRKPPAPPKTKVVEATSEGDAAKLTDIANRRAARLEAEGIDTSGPKNALGLSKAQAAYFDKALEDVKEGLPEKATTAQKIDNKGRPIPRDFYTTGGVTIKIPGDGQFTVSGQDQAARLAEMNGKKSIPTGTPQSFTKKGTGETAAEHFPKEAEANEQEVRRAQYDAGKNVYQVKIKDGVIKYYKGKPIDVPELPGKHLAVIDIEGGDKPFAVTDLRSSRSIVSGATHDAAVARLRDVIKNHKGDFNKLFDERQQEALRENKGELNTVHTGEPETLNQRQGTNRGSVEFNNQDASAIVRALKDPNASTLPHEFAHIFRRAAYRDKMLTPEEFETVEKWVGIRDADGNRVGSWGDMEDGVAHREEKWSRGLERFLADGTAPSEALKSVFQKFVAWMKDIYAKTQPDYAGTPLDVELTPEIRKVFDKLLGGEHAPLETVAEARTREASAKASLQAMDESLKPKAEAPKVEDAKPEAPKKPAPTYIGSMNEGKFPSEVHDAMKKIVDENGLADKETASFPLVNQLANSLKLSYDNLKDWGSEREGELPTRPTEIPKPLWRPVWQRAVTNLNMKALHDMQLAEGALKDAKEELADNPTPENEAAVRAAEAEHKDAEDTATITARHDDALRNASGTGQVNYKQAPSAVDSGVGFKGLANHAEALTNIVNEGKEAEALLASADKMSGEGPKVPSVPRPKGKPSRVRTVTAEAAAKLRDEWKAQGPTRLNQSDAPKNPQTETPEFRNWFGESKVVGADGKPTTVYHGTESGDITQFKPGTFFTTDKGEAKAYASLTDADAIPKISYVRAEDAPEIPKSLNPDTDYTSDYQDVTVPNKVFVNDPNSRLFYWDGTDSPTGDHNIRILSGVVERDGKIVKRPTKDGKFIDPDVIRGNQKTIPAYLSIKNPVTLPWDEANLLGRRLGANDKGINAQIEKWKYQGYDGIETESDDAKIFQGRSVKQYIPFDPKQIKSAIGNRGTFDPNDANILHQSAPDPLEGIGVFHYEEGNKTFEPWRAAMEKFLGEKLPDNKAKYVYSQVLGLKARAGKIASAAALKTAEPLFKDHIADLGRKGNAKFLRDLPEDLRNKVLEGRPIEDFTPAERQTVAKHYDANRVKPKDDPNAKSSFKAQSTVKQIVAEASRLKNAPARSERMKALNAKRTAGPPKPIDPVVRTLRASLRGNYDAFTKELEAQHPGIVERLKAGEGTKEDYAAAGEAAVKHSPDKDTTTPTETQMKVREALRAAREKAKPAAIPKGPTQGPPTAADAWAKKLTGPLGKEGVTKLRADMGEVFDRVADGSATPAEHARVSAAYEAIRKAKTSEPGAPALNVAPGFADALKDLRDSQKPDVVPKVKLSDIPQTEQSKFGQRVKAALKDNTDAFFDELRNDHRDIANTLDRAPESLTYEQNQRLGDLFVKHSPDPVTPAKATGMVKALNDAVKEVKADKTAADYADKKGVKDEDLTGYNLIDDGQPEPAKYGAFDTIVGRRVEGGAEAAGKIRADLLRDDVGRSAVQKLINDPANLTKDEARRLARAIDAEAKIGKRSDPNEVTARLTKLMRDARAGRLDLVTGKDLVRKHLSEKYTKDLTGGKLSKAEVTAKVNKMMEPVNADLDKLKDNDWDAISSMVSKHDARGFERFMNNLGHYYRANLLSNSASLPAIFTSHVMSNMWERGVMDPLAELIDKANSSHGERSVSANYKDMLRSTRAIPKGIKQAVSILKAGENSHSVSADMSIADRNLGSEFNIGLDRVADKIANPQAARAVRNLGVLMNSMPRIWNRQHGAVFSLAGVPIYDNALRDASRLKAINEGLKGVDAEERAQKLYENPTPDIEEQAELNYKEKMFSNKNAYADFVRNLMEKGGPGGRLIGNVLQPFANIPSNIAGRSIEATTPLPAIIKLVKLMHDGDRSTPSQRADTYKTIARYIGGTAVMHIAYTYAQNLHAMNQQKHDYSPTLDAFGKKIEVGRLAPAINAASVGRLFKERGGKGGFHTLDYPESVAGEGPYMGLISQFESVFPEVSGHEKEDTIINKSEKAGAQLLSGWLPGSALLNATAASFDPSGHMRRADNWGDVLARHIPSIPGLPNKIRGHAISRTGLKIMHEQAKGKDVYGNKIQGKSVPEAGGIKLLRYTKAPPRKTQ